MTRRRDVAARSRADVFDDVPGASCVPRAPRDANVEDNVHHGELFEHVVNRIGTIHNVCSLVQCSATLLNISQLVSVTLDNASNNAAVMAWLERDLAARI